MNTYIALLRGINVSGQKKIKMAELRESFDKRGYQSVSTYIQSGNIVFLSEQNDHRHLEDEIAKLIMEDFGFDVPVIVIEKTNMEHSISNNPFLQDEEKPLDRQYITFLGDMPPEEKVNQIQALDYPSEEFILSGKTIYFFSPKGYGKAKMNNNFFEQKLKVKATTRNWKTVNVLLKMAKETED